MSAPRIPRITEIALTIRQWCYVFAVLLVFVWLAGFFVGILWNMAS